MASLEKGRKVLTELITKPTESKRESILELKKEIITAKKVRRILAMVAI